MSKRRREAVTRGRAKRVCLADLDTTLSATAREPLVSPRRRSVDHAKNETRVVAPLRTPWAAYLEQSTEVALMTSPPAGVTSKRAAATALSSPTSYVEAPRAVRERSFDEAQPPTSLFDQTGLPARRQSAHVASTPPTHGAWTPHVTPEMLRKRSSSNDPALEATRLDFLDCDDSDIGLSPPDDEYLPQGTSDDRQQQQASACALDVRPRAPDELFVSVLPTEVLRPRDVSSRVALVTASPATTERSRRLQPAISTSKSSSLIKAPSGNQIRRSSLPSTEQKRKKKKKTVTFAEGQRPGDWREPADRTSLEDSALDKHETTKVLGAAPYGSCEASDDQIRTTDATPRCMPEPGTDLRPNVQGDVQEKLLLHATSPVDGCREMPPPTLLIVPRPLRPATCEVARVQAAVPVWQTTMDEVFVTNNTDPVTRGSTKRATTAVPTSRHLALSREMASSGNQRATALGALVKDSFDVSNH
ncbi:hypothetical protein SDRG_11717 [Saprolegnia diclina VS20]|uniref:Uncharacterized protein n=1 Tax=Saprolegnia diclina (strain VS20) TaxID=1156394 RepID=T0RL51_SAPDV|nr:hypothetical protein SDRG_11717 [Saprolegnia diclina VS20]EQC30662.1 hypothetical protein SDRG_11717 [Saprolegnia diclina VS20]|eukprot:XP_008615988.1 hypothetical protein SDRG_11717 [Saprolegnia diclina VS20]